MAKRTFPSRKEARLSPRQRRLVDQLIAKRRWMITKELCAVEFGKDERSWPWNARMLVTGALLVAAKKLKSNGNNLQLKKVGGGRSGTSYMIEERK